jgi:hypothetical protein
MRTIVATVALILASSVANAGPVYLSCDGNTTVLIPNEKDHVIKEMRTLALDLSANTVTVEGRDPTPILRADEQRVDFEPKDWPEHGGVATGLLNRITGDVHIAFVGPTGEAYAFRGTCKPARKLF